MTTPASKKSAASSARGKTKAGNLFELEGPLWQAGFVRVAGVDEAGRGPLAGPVVAAAAVFEPRVRLRGLDDSKKLNEAERDRLAIAIRERALAVGVGMASVREIDAINIYQASHLAARRALDALAPLVPDALVTDMLKLHDRGVPCEAHPKADGRSHAVAAASVIAKTVRDALMVRYDAEFPGYGFAQHKGYPAPVHLAALDALGIATLHRLTYAPVESRLIPFEPPRLRWSLTGGGFRRELLAGRMPMEWAMAREEWRAFLPEVEVEELDRLTLALEGAPPCAG